MTNQEQQQARIERRMQDHLRALIERKRGEGWEVVARDPLTLGRVGCKQQYQVSRSGLLVAA